jgi:hypothetical protein
MRSSLGQKMPSTSMPRIQTFGTTEAKNGGSSQCRSSASLCELSQGCPVQSVINSPLNAVPHVLSRLGDQMRRRDFLTFLGSAAGWVATARGEEPRHIVGCLTAFSTHTPGALAAFYQGLKETGYIEGENINVEFRMADGHYDRG